LVVAAGLVAVVGAVPVVIIAIDFIGLIAVVSAEELVTGIVDENAGGQEQLSYLGGTVIKYGSEN
jgi:hypothetical protein